MSIRKLVTGALAAFALSAGAANAETALSYYVSGHVNYADLEVGGADGDDTFGGVSGAVAFAATQNIGVQIDADVTFADNDLIDDETISGTVHVFHRTAAGLIGGFIGAADVSDETVIGGGVEGAVYKGDWTFGGNLVYANADDADLDYWGLNGYAQYYFNDNLAADVALGYGNADAGGSDADVLSIAAGAEYQLSSMPVGFGVQLAYLDAGDIDADALSLSVRARYVFTGENLRTRNQTGASQRGFLSQLTALVL
ncbi:MAG: hypothetical protein ABW199_11770 [Caulobacterales bacterium]